ncbi:MAG: tetratricopeptide repeat protein [Planctomycetes bacterium]|nr:tetratricopeptide repeat protein [Planctomycetota bacterium]
MRILKIVVSLVFISLLSSSVCISKESEEHYQRGLGYLETGLGDKALNEFKKALPLFKDEKNQQMVAEVYVALAHIYNWNGLYKIAITVCKQAIGISPDHAYAHYNLGFALREEGEIQLAKNEFALYNDLLKQQGEYVETSGGETLKSEDIESEPVEAAKASNDVVASSTADEKVLESSGSDHLKRGIEYYNDGTLDEAISEFQEALKDDPDNVDVHLNLGNAYVDKEMFEDAISQYEKVIALDPNHIDATLDLGMLYMDFDQVDEALILYKKASTANPENAYLHFHLGEAHYLKERYDKAISEFNKAVSINSMDPEIQYRLAEVYNEIEKFDLALKHVNRASELGYPVDQELVDDIERRKE